MSERAPSSQHNTADGAQPRVSEKPLFKFESIVSASPIRFNPDAPDDRANTNRGLLSSPSSSMTPLSSSVTPEAITLSIKTATGPDHPLAVNKNTGLDLQSSAVNSPILRLTTNASSVESSTVTSNTRSESVIEVSNSPAVGTAPYQAPLVGKKPPGKLTTQYVMPDGSVITGKGLGRGRPGVKRGPRRSKLPGDEMLEETPPADTPGPKSSLTPIGGKRKRADSETSNIRARSVSSSLDSRESSVEYNPTATQTRSGRQTQKPMLIIAQATTPTMTASPANKKVSTPTTATPTLKTHPKIKRKIYRGKEQFALCEHCLRGFGPTGNVIVFCDACNKCWHQRCHQPQIPKELIADSKAEWFCATCDKILHGSKKLKRVPLKGDLSPPPPPPQQRFGPPLVGAIALTIEQRKKYLETLSRDQLVNLLLRAGELAPQMPIFETPIPLPRVGPSLQPQFTSNYVTPVTETPSVNAAIAHDVPDEGYDDSYDEWAALYPKIGEGIQLPPERDDLNILLEGPDSRTFSHWVKGLPVKTVVDTVPLHQSQFQSTRPAA